MDPNPTASTVKEQVTSTVNIAQKYSKESSISNQQLPEEMCACDSEMVLSENPEAEVHVDQVMWTSQDDEEIDRELNSKDSDINKFIEDFKEFHALMIQLNEAQYYGRQMDTVHASIETDLLDLMGELAYRRAEEAEELRQKAELDELLKSITDDEDNKEENVSLNEDNLDDSQRVAMEVLEDLLNKVVEDGNNSNSDIIVD